MNTKTVGERKTVQKDWTIELARVGATTIVSSSWDVESGTVTLGTTAWSGALSTAKVLGGTAGAISVAVNTILTDTGDRLVARMPIYVTPGADGLDLWTVYVGVGAEGLQSAALAALPSSAVSTPVAIWPLSPTAQKVYFCWPAELGDFRVTLGGFDVDLLADRTVSIDGISCLVKESTNFLTWTALQFRIQAL